MAELIPWFHQILNAVEQTARDAGGEHPTWVQGAPDWIDGEGDVIVPTPDKAGVVNDAGETVVYDEGRDPLLDTHIAFHNPARVLRQVEADRRILAEYERMLFRDPLRVGPYRDGVRDMCEMAVRARAEAYDDQPGYREVWRQCPTT